MEACLRECESEVVEMAQVSLIKTKLPQPGVTLAIQRSFPLNSHAPFLFFFFNFFFLPRFHYLARGSGWWMQQ